MPKTIFHTVHTTRTTVFHINTHYKLYNVNILQYAQNPHQKTQQNAQLNITKLLTSIYQITIIIYRKTIKLY